MSDTEADNVFTRCDTIDTLRVNTQPDEPDPRLDGCTYSECNEDNPDGSVTTEKNNETIQTAVNETPDNAIEVYIPDDSMGRQTDVNTGNSDEKRILVSSTLTYENNVPPQKSECEKAYACLKKILIPVFGIILYSYDIATDIQIALSYKERNDKKLFLYTILALVCPACFIMIMDIGWLIIDYKKARNTGTHNVKTNRATESGDANRNENRSEYQTSEETKRFWQRLPDICKLVLRIVVTVMTVGAGGRVCRTIQYTYYFVKSDLASTTDRHDEFKKRARHMKRDCLMMNFTEAFLESAPQFALQLYITYALDRNFTSLRVLNLVTSALSITWSYSAYYRCNRANINNKEDVKLIPFLIYLLSVASCIVPRFISFVLFAVYFETAGIITVLGVFGIHVFVGFIVIALQVKPKLNGTVEYLVFRWLFYAFFAYVTFFLFLNLEHYRISETSNEEEAKKQRNWFEEKKTKRRMILLYAFIHLENLILATLLVSCRLDLMADGFFVLIVVLIGAFVQLICLSSYYYFFHKTRSRKNAL